MKYGNKMPPEGSRADLEKLRALVRRLRAPDGCPWDREQGFSDLRAYLLEEAHEVADALDRSSLEDLRGELGDLLFQVVFLSVLAEERGAFDLAQVIDEIHGKMVSRHPHVFGDEKLADAGAVRDAWERRKLREEPRQGSLLDGVAGSLPALTAAYRLTQKAAGVGFDWPDAAAVLGKLEEELAELRGELARAPRDRGALAEELGDLLFTAANLARHLDLDPEAALARANVKFRTRFAAVEAGLKERGRRLGETTLEEMDQLWEQVKKRG
jgi:MazG family protein